MASPGPGNVSTRSAVRDASTRFPFEIVRVSLETPPEPMTAGRNDFATLGGWNGFTNRRSVAAAALLPAFVWRAFAGIVFAYGPPGVPDVTFTTTVQPPGWIVPPVSVTLVAVVEATPPGQVVDAIGRRAPPRRSREGRPSTGSRGRAPSRSRSRA